MAVALDANATNFVQGTGIASLTTSNLTVGSGANRALVAQIAFSLKTVSAITVRWDELGTPQSLASIISASGTGTTCRVELWGLVAPTTGAKQLKAAWTGASDCYINQTSFTGAHQTGGTTTFPNSVSSTGTTSTNPQSITQAITSAVGNYTMAHLGNDLGSVTTPVLQTQAYIDNALAIGAGASYGAGAATVTHGFDLSGATLHWVFVGHDIAVPAASGDTQEWLPRWAPHRPIRDQNVLY